MLISFLYFYYLIIKMTVPCADDCKTRMYLTHVFVRNEKRSFTHFRPLALNFEMGNHTGSERKEKTNPRFLLKCSNSHSIPRMKNVSKGFFAKQNTTQEQQDTAEIGHLDLTRPLLTPHITQKFTANTTTSRANTSTCALD